MDTEKLISIIEEILEKYYNAEVDAMSQFEKPGQGDWEKDLDYEIVSYRNQIKKLLIKT